MFVFRQGTGWANKGLVETMNSGDVPGVAGQGTREEAALVVGEIGDDHFDDIQGKLSGGGQACRRSPQKRPP